MITDSTRRQASLNLLQKLRRQGLPNREEKMDSMFDSLTSGEGESEPGDDKEGTDSPDYELQSPAEQAKEREKKKATQLEPGKVDKFKKGFMGTK
jgi:hypothetical protein